MRVLKANARRMFLVALFLCGWSTSVLANVGAAFGFGSKIAALGGAGVGSGYDAFSIYNNPASLGLSSEKRLLFSYGLIYMNPSFTEIRNVVTQNQYVADAKVVGDVDTQYQSTLGQQLALTYRLFPETGNLTLGILTFFPLEQLALMDTGEAYVPEYVLYRAWTQRPQVELGTGVHFGGGFHAGFGLHVAFTMSGNTRVFLNTQTNTISSMRFIASLKPKVAPYFGFLYTPGYEKDRTYSVGAVFRFAASSDATIKVESAARVFGNLAALDFRFNALSTLYYDPMALEIGGSLQHFEIARLYAQVEYQLWSQYQAPALLIQQPETTKCDSPACGTLQISPGNVPTFSYANIWVPRIGEEVALSDTTTLRIGYAYRPSILKDLPTGAGNFLDPPKHMINLGLGLNYQHFLGQAVPCRLDFNLAYHYLMKQAINKTPGNEVGNTSDEKIGAPGYEAGGKMLGGGVSLSLAI